MRVFARNDESRSGCFLFEGDFFLECYGGAGGFAFLFFLSFYSGAISHELRGARGEVARQSAMRFAGYARRFSACGLGSSFASRARRALPPYFDFPVAPSASVANGKGFTFLFFSSCYSGATSHELRGARGDFDFPP